ncbi:hypothetical protein [Neobacillus sp. FSL H8-0543]|uniref:hypothetical protein n=1 Tax=Neobacillus sp. FSL H8-0543 TaxID=2954672 RepID=UPI0031592728
MYRFSIKGEKWILRFSPQLIIDIEVKQAVLKSLMEIGNELSEYSHGEAFLMFTKEIGAIVFDVERMPSFILTVSNIIPEENWYAHENSLKQTK